MRRPPHRLWALCRGRGDRLSARGGDPIYRHDRASDRRAEPTGQDTAIHRHDYPVDHIGIAVADLEEATRLYSEILGLRHVYHEIVADQGVEVSGFAAGEVVIELLKPLSTDSAIARFRGDSPSKLHHVAYRVSNINSELARLKARGVRLIDEVPRKGAHGNMIAFLHPKSTGGVLLELCEPLP